MDQRAQFFGRLGQFQSGMLTTLSSDGAPHVRPMAVARLDEDCSIWFLTQDSSEVVTEIRTDEIGTVSFQRDPDLYVVVNGFVHIVHDIRVAKQLWQESLRTWFPEGLDDKTMSVMKLEPHSGEYWENAGASRLRSAYEFVRSTVTGSDTVIPTGGQHVKAMLIGV